MRLGLSHLRERKFKHSFQDNLNQFCNCGCEIETTAHFPLHCLQFYTERNTLLNKIKSIYTSTLNQNNSNFSKTLVFGDPNRHTNTTTTTNATIDFVLDTERFDVPLF